MVGLHVLKEAAGVGLQNLIVLHAAHLHDLLHQGLSQDILFSVVRLDDGVALPGVEGDGQVTRQGPDGGGPDQEKEVCGGQVGQLGVVHQHGELHIDGGARVVLILNLRLSQGGLVVGAPVHRLEALVDIAVLIHSPENFHFLRLEGGGHGEVGVLPVTDDAHALKALPLHVHIVLGELVAGGAELGDGHGLAVELVLLDDGALNGHAVVVPAGDVGGEIPPHGGGAGHEVLDGLVQGVAHVQRAVGEGRAVVEAVKGFSFILFQQLVVEVHVLPAFQHVGLPGGQPRPHGKVGFWQIDGLVVVHFVLLLCYITFRI